MPDTLTAAVQKGLDAAKWGFDWHHAADAIDKVEEETLEVREALLSGDSDALREEIGDLLFAVCNVARKTQIDPERALSEANEKFWNRFESTLEHLKAQGIDPIEADLSTMESAWLEVKNAGR